MKRERCPKTGKLIFDTSTEAEREVERAQQRRASGEIPHARGKEGRIEQRVHPCLSGCGKWHMTAMDEPADRLTWKPRQRGRR
jgi:hypothetical protein